jgi:chitinase
MRKIYLLIFLVATLNQVVAQSENPRPVVIGYVGGYRSKVIDMSAISATKLTHVNYAFVNVMHNRAVLSHERTDTVNLKNLSQLKKRNPNIKLLISIGGWTWSGNFSDAVLSDTARQAFAKSAVNILKRFSLDGIDIDWEYPDMAGSGHAFRKEDKQNYTLMFMELRKQLDAAGQKAGEHYLLTTATGGFKAFLNHTEMGKVAHYLDYINLMTYDYFGEGKVVIHHSNLYSTSKWDDSGDRTVTDYLAAGVPGNKLVLGIAFYGRMFQLKSNSMKGLGDSTASYMRGRDYSFIKDSLVNQNGFVMYRDTVARAPYLFNANNKQFISYEDEWSVQYKCRYVLDKKLAGVMFWEYDSDPKDNLLDQINATFK